MSNPTKLVLVDDHSLLRNGLASLISNIGYEVLYECGNGQDLIDKIGKNELPDLILMDIRMPEMDGFDTTLWLKKNYPLINVIALSMHDDENCIIRMIRNGARGYILKDASTQELKSAIESVMSKGFYYSDLVSGRLVRSIREDDNEEQNVRKLVLGLNAKEIEFLKLAATELTYKEIAEKMHLSPRTIDGYRDSLFQKLDIKSRVGLVLFAIKNGIIHLN
jgi:two-component system invasion response regulator UvrY